MNSKELGEIRRRIRPERSAIRHIYGCYVNGAKEIISYVDESMGLMSKEESEEYLTLLRKSLSGTLGRSLMEISFATKQVMDSDEHRLLSALRRTKLEDAALRDEFYKCVIGALDMEASNYLILLANDNYDVPHRGRDGQYIEDGDSVFSYILCCICPVKSGKAALGFSSDENRFHSCAVNQIVSSPELGFMVPAFDDRAANIYAALFYSRSAEVIHQEFIDAVFKTDVPMSPVRQREAFSEALSAALEQECSYGVVQSVHEQLSERIELHRESKDPEQLRITVDEVADILESSGMSAERAGSFAEKCGEEFGKDAELTPMNIIDAKHFEVCTPEVTVKVDPKYSALISTRVIDGRRYILIPADGGVEVNGISVTIPEE